MSKDKQETMNRLNSDVKKALRRHATIWVGTAISFAATTAILNRIESKKMRESYSELDFVQHEDGTWSYEPEN